MHITGELERLLDHMVLSLIMFVIILFLEQVQSIDYSGDEVQVTTTDGTGCAAQKVRPRILLAAAECLRGRKTVFSTKQFAFDL